MRNSTTTGETLGGAVKPNPVPEVGQTIILEFAPYGGMHELYGSAYYPNGSYVEVEVKAVKTAKLVFE